MIYSVLFLLGWNITIKYNELNSNDHFSNKPADYLLVKISNEPKLNGDLLRFTATVEDNVQNGEELMVLVNYHPYLINKLQKQAEAQHINYHTLLRNKSMIVSSN